MLRLSLLLGVLVVAGAFATAAHAQYYVSPAPTIAYYTPPAVSYSTYRYGLLPRRTVTVANYYAPTVSYYTPAPTVSYYTAPSVSYYAPTVSYYAPAPTVSYYTAPTVSYYPPPAVYTPPAVQYYLPFCP